MSRKWNFINNVLSLGLTIGLIFLSATVNKNPYSGDMAGYIALYVVGAIIFGILNTLFHELGHVISGKIRGFKFYSMTVWFFHFKKENGKINFGFNWIGNEAGYTEMIPTRKETVGKDFMKMTLGGIIASLILTIISILPIIFNAYLPIKVFALLAMGLPVSVYFFLGSVLPMISDGVKNDGLTALSYHRRDESSRVGESVLKAQADLYAGVLPKDLNEELLFTVPQIMEDDLNFVALLDLRYAYYLDKGDYENAVKVNERLLAIDRLPKQYYLSVLAESLYIYSAINKNEEKAEETLYDLDKYINSVNTAQNIRIKLAYLIEILGETSGLEMFFDKAERECKKMPLKGVADYERNLIAPLKAKAVFETETEEQ